MHRPQNCQTYAVSRPGREACAHYVAAIERYRLLFLDMVDGPQVQQAGASRDV
jgi:hypothetical protein